MNDTVRMDVDGEHAEYGPFRISVDVPVRLIEPDSEVEFIELVHQMLLPGSGASNLEVKTSVPDAMVKLGFKDMSWRKAAATE